MYTPKAIPEDSAALARAYVASCQETRRRCMELAQTAAAVAHEAVQADLLDDWEAASILYRKATVLLEQAAEDVTSEQCVPDPTAVAVQPASVCANSWDLLCLVAGTHLVVCLR